MAIDEVTVEVEQEGNGDSTLHQRHAAMLQRLAVNEDARLQKFAARRADTLSFENPNESTDRFLQSFSQSGKQLEQALSSLQLMVSSEESKDSAKNDLDLAAIRISELEQFLAEHSYFLPAYEVRASQTTISSLREKLNCVNAELLPKKRFSFKSKASKEKRTIEDLSAKASQSLQTCDLDSDTSKGMQQPQHLSADNKNKESEHSQGFSLNLACSICDLEGTVVVRDLENDEDSEIILENLTNCRVFIRGICRAMYAHKLRSCKVYAGPVMGSALIEDIEDCTLMLASQQIRIHNAKRTDMYLRVRSRPIVEYTRDIGFAPYAFTYHGIEDDLSIANLSEETGLWAKVDDFRWLRAIPSPNWSVLPEKERVGPVDGSAVSPGAA